jgi:hypothetical protein
VTKERRIAFNKHSCAKKNSKLGLAECFIVYTMHVEWQYLVYTLVQNKAI